MSTLRILPFLCLFAPFAGAGPITPEAATSQALEHNPRLAAVRALIAESEARAAGLGRLPNPELETELAGGSGDRARLEVGLSQTFPRASRLRLERRVADETLVLARLEVAVAEAEIIARAHTALVDLAAADAALALAERQASLARSFAEEQRRQVAEGLISALDADLADLVATEALLAIESPRIERLAAVHALAAALGREQSDDLLAELSLALPAEAGVQADANRRPDLTLAEAALAAGDADIALARSLGRGEDIRVGVFAEGERNERTLFGLRVGMPLPVRNIAAPAVAEKQAARRRLALERDAIAMTVRHEFTATAAELTARHASARAVSDRLLPAARAHLASVEAAHARGEIPIDHLFRSRERLFALERSDLEARHTYHLARVRHLAAAGALAP